MKNLSTILFVFFFASSALAKDYLPEVEEYVKETASAKAIDWSVSVESAEAAIKALVDQGNAKKPYLKEFYGVYAQQIVACGRVPLLWKDIPVEKLKKVARNGLRVPKDLVTPLNKLGNAMNTCIRKTSEFYQANVRIHEERMHEHCKGDLSIKGCFDLAEKYTEASEVLVKNLSKMSKDLLTPAAILSVIDEKWTIN